MTASPLCRIIEGKGGVDMNIREDRRALHRIPELDRNLPETFAYLNQVLSGLNCRVFAPVAGSLCAWSVSYTHLRAHET